MACIKLENKIVKNKIYILIFIDIVLIESISCSILAQVLLATAELNDVVRPA